VSSSVNGSWVQAAQNRFLRIQEDCRQEVGDAIATLEDRGLSEWLQGPGAYLQAKWANELETLAREVTAPVWERADAIHKAAQTAMGDALAKRADWSSPAEDDVTWAAFKTKMEQKTALAQDGLALARQVLDHSRIPETVRSAVLSGRHLAHTDSAWRWLGGHPGMPTLEQPDENNEYTDPDGRVWILEQRLYSSGGMTAHFHVYRLKRPPAYLGALVDALIDDWTKEASHKRTNAPALVRPVYTNLGTALSAIPIKRQIIDRRQLQIPGLRPCIPEGSKALIEAMEAASKASPTLAHRLIRSLVQWGTNAWMSGEDMRLKVYAADGHELWAQRTAGGVSIWSETGGLEFFRKAVGHPSKDGNVGDILRIFARYGAEWQTPTSRGSGPLLHWGEGKERGRVHVTLTALLLPGVAGRKDDPLRAEDNQLIPTLPLPDLTPLSNRCAGQLCSLDWLAVEVFAGRRAELRKEKSVYMDWMSLARSAGFASRSTVPAKALAYWAGETDDKNGQRWVRVQGVKGSMTGHFTLLGSGAEGQALQFIMEGAERSARGRVNGQARARKRIAIQGDRRKR